MVALVIKGGLLYRRYAYEDTLSSGTEFMKDLDSPDAEKPSKSARKREMQRLQELGEQLVALPQKAFTSIDLPDDLREAVATARTIRSREARRRQLQYIGRIMRSVDAAPISAKLQQYQQTQQATTRNHHRLEQLRDSFIEADDRKMTELVQSIPNADQKLLLRLAKSARTECQQGPSGKASRALFRYLRDQ